MKRKKRLIPPLVLEITAFTCLLVLLALSGQTKTDYFELGVQHALEGKPKKAVKWLNKAIDLDPQNADAYYNRALAFQRMGGEEVAAIADYSMCIRLRPTDVEAHVNRAVAHMRIEEFSYAIADLQKAIAIRPDHSLSHLNLGLVYRMVGEEAKACESLERASGLGSTEATIMVNDCLPK